MPQLLALEWNGDEARAAVGSRHGTRAVIEQAFAIPLVTASAEGEPAPLDIGQQIADGLAAHGIGPIDALVAVGRGSVELRQLQLPAVPDDELPEIVRLQALTEFNELDEKWPLDFVPVDEPGGGTRRVLAAAIAPAQGERIQEVCRRSGLRMQHLVLRPCATASLAARSQTAKLDQVQLLVEPLADQADLTVTVGRRVLFLRTMRLGDEPARRHSLAAEIKLTMAAVQNQYGGRKVAGIVLCGRGEADAALAKQIEKDVAARTTLLDPFAGLELGDQVRGSPPAAPGRFAAVLGMLLAEFDKTGHAIDFLNPRRAVERKPPRNKWKMAAVAAAALLVAYFVYGRVEHWWLADEVSRLDARSRQLDKAVAAAEKVRASTAEIGKWADGEVLWLDQLRELNADVPKADSIRLSRLTVAVPSAAVGGEIQLEGWAKNAEAIATMEQALRAHSRRVVGISSREDRSSPPYSWQFKTSVFVGREPKP